MINFLNLLPDELKVTINRYADNPADQLFRMLDKATHALALAVIKNINIFPPTKSSKESNDILVRLITQYPNLQKITFGKNNNNQISLFSTEHSSYLESLISHLDSNPEKHPLSSVKKIEFLEIIEQVSDKKILKGLKPFSFNEEAKANLKDLNRRFLNAVGHERLQNVIIRTNGARSILTGDEIQPILTNSPNLKTFVYDGYHPKEEISLSFKGLSELTKVKMFDWKGPISTLESLRDCKKLEELVMHSKADSTPIKAILSENTEPWSLKRLEVPGLVVENDEELKAITEKLPNLEYLSIDLSETITEEGLEYLGKNCPKLKALQFSHLSLTNSQLDKLTQQLPNLELISLQTLNNLETKITCIAKNCKKLQGIKVTHFDSIGRHELELLADNCPNLRLIGFTYGKFVAMEDMCQLAEKLNLKYVTIDDIFFNKQGIKKFYESFKKIKKIPYLTSLKKLHNLTIESPRAEPLNLYSQ